MQDDAADAQWFSVVDLPVMAFDHKLVVRTAFESLLQRPEARNNGKTTPERCRP